MNFLATAWTISNISGIKEIIIFPGKLNYMHELSTMYVYHK